MKTIADLLSTKTTASTISTVTQVTKEYRGFKYKIIITNGELTITNPLTCFGNGYFDGLEEQLWHQIDAFIEWKNDKVLMDIRDLIRKFREFTGTDNDKQFSEWIWNLYDREAHIREEINVDGINIWVWKPFPEFLVKEHENELVLYYAYPYNIELPRYTFYR